MARTKINDKQLEKIVSSDKVAGASINITGSTSQLTTLTGGDHFLVQSGSSDPVKITADVMQDFFSKIDIVETSTNASFQILFADDDSSGGGDGVVRVDGSHLNYNPSSNLLTVAANLGLSAQEIDVASGDLTLDVAGDIKLDADGADVIFLDGGTESARLTMDGTTSIELAAQGDIILDPAGNNVLPGADSEDDLGKDASSSTIASGFHSSLKTSPAQTLDNSLAVPFIRFADGGSLPSGVGSIQSGDTITVTDSNSEFTATASGAGATDAVLIDTTSLASSLKAMTYSASAGSSITAIRLSSQFSGGSAISAIQQNDTVVMGDGTGQFTATVSGAPSNTHALASFLTFSSGQTITASTTSINVSSIPSEVSVNVKSGDTIELVQGGVTATATLSSDPSGSSYAFSSGFTFSGGSSVSTDSSFSTARFKGVAIPISSVSFNDSNNVTFDGDPSGKTAQVKARGIPLQAGTASGSAASSDTFASATATRAVARVAWREIFVDNVNLNGQGKLKLDDDGDTHISSPADDVIEVFAGDAHALSVSGSSVDILVGLVAKGDVDLGDATSDTITVTGRFDSDLVPSSDGARDLGSSALEWKDLYIDGVAYVDSLQADQLGAALDANDQAITNINVDSGAIDGAVIGANSAAAATVTTLSATGDVDLGDATSDTITATGRFDSDLVPSSDSARSLGSSALQWANIHADEGNIDTVVATQLTASAIRVTELDVVTINSINQTEQTLEIEDKLIVAAVSASSGNADGGGLRIGGADGEAAGHASVLWNHGSSSLHLNVGGEVQLQVKDGSVLPGKDDNVDLGSSALQFKDLYLDGVARIDSLQADQLGAALDANDQAITNINVDSGAIDGTVIGGSSAAAGTFTSLVAGGNVDLGDATSDTITATGRFDSDLVPSTDSARALGSATLQWSAAHVDVGHIDQLGSALDANSQAITNINVDSGAIDGTAIGANSHSTAKVTTLEATSTVTLSSLAALSASVSDDSHHLLVVDSDDNIIKKEAMPDIVGSFAAKFAGDGLHEAAGVLSVQPVIEMATKFSRGAILSNDFATASLAHVPLSGSLQVFLNGMLQTPSGSVDGDGPQDYTGVLSGSNSHSEELWDYVHQEQTGSHYVYFQEPIDEDDVVQLRYLKK